MVKSDPTSAVSFLDLFFKDISRSIDTRLFLREGNLRINPEEDQNNQKLIVG